MRTYILPIIIISQLAGGLLWFAVNAVIPDLQSSGKFGENLTGNLTSVIQFGFIAGTFVFSLLSIADRFSPSKIFFISSIVAAASNLAILLVNDISGLYALRFTTGFFLAGIYPVGMKIAADWFPQTLGKALGWLVGALVLGTAMPHLFRSGMKDVDWENVVRITSICALAGGLMVFFFVKDGPYRKKGSRLNLKAITEIFKPKDFRAAAFGYFGHMWELYAFWAFIPIILSSYADRSGLNVNVELWSFIVLGSGFCGCVIGGFLSRIFGSAPVAFYALIISGISCFTVFLFVEMSPAIFFPFMILWGAAAAADSPQFSAMVATNAEPSNKGTALTMVTCIGFAITIISIQLLEKLIREENNLYTFLLLVPGPVIGLIAMRRLMRKTVKS